MKKLICILIFSFLFMVIFVGCIKPSPTISPRVVRTIEYCTQCPDEDKIISVLSQVCQCFSKNITYTTNFDCTNSLNKVCREIPIEAKKRLAIINDHWYCVCNETVKVESCTGIHTADECRREVDIITVNRTTEFIWSY